MRLHFAFWMPFKVDKKTEKMCRLQKNCLGQKKVRFDHRPKPSPLTIVKIPLRQGATPIYKLQIKSRFFHHEKDLVCEVYACVYVNLYIYIYYIYIWIINYQISYVYLPRMIAPVPNSLFTESSIPAVLPGIKPRIEIFRNLRRSSNQSLSFRKPKPEYWVNFLRECLKMDF